MHSNHFVDSNVSLDSFIVLDIETTGVNCKDDKIIEIAAIRYDGFKETNVFSSLINPQMMLPDAITRLTGITQIELETAPVWENIQTDFMTFIGTLPLVGHNICGFDIRFIEKAIGHKITVPIIDTLDLARCAFPELPSHKLTYLNSALSISSQNAHRALDDARTTFTVLEKCLHELAHEGSVMINCCTCEAPQKTDRPASKKYGEHVNIKAITPTRADIDTSCPLCGKSIVFTGTLSIPREEAMQLAVPNTHIQMIECQKISVIAGQALNFQHLLHPPFQQHGRSADLGIIVCRYVRPELDIHFAVCADKSSGIFYFLG